MKKRIFSILLALCLMVGILPTSVWAEGGYSGTVVWFDTTNGGSGQPVGYIYDGSRFIAIGDEYSVALGDPALQVGQQVSFDVVEREPPAAVAGTLTVTNTAAMSLSISGNAWVDEDITISASNAPTVGSVSVQLYHAANQSELFLDSNKLGAAFELSDGTATYTVTSDSIGKYIGAKATYTVNAGGLDHSTTFTAQLAEPVTGGSCGDNLTWYITRAGEAYTLNITGTGAMNDYGDNDAPWLALSYVNNITSLTFSEGITHIGNYAFSNGGVALVLQSTAFPSTLESIGDYAFYYCYREGDISLTLPNGPTTLGKGVFQNCSGLSEIILPDSLMTVGANLFTGTSSNPLTVYCLAGTAEELPSWAKAEYLDSTHPERITIHGLTHHETLEATCVTPGTEEYYTFEAGEAMAGRYYNAEKTAYTDEPVTIPATGLHTMDENGLCSVCNQTFPVLASVKIGDGAAAGYETMTDALSVANAVPGSETVTVKALNNSTDGYLAGVTLTRAAPIVLDLGGFTVESDSRLFTVNGADVTVKNGTLNGDYNSVLSMSSGKLNLENGLTLNNLSDMGSYALEIVDGTVSINGAALTAVHYALSQGGGTLVINSGSFSQGVRITNGTTTLNGGTYNGDIEVFRGGIADILGENCAYKYISPAPDSSAWETEPTVLAGKFISGVTVQAAPVRLNSLTISNGSVDSDYAAGPVLSVTAEKTDAADAGDISYKWEYSLNGGEFKTEDGTHIVPANSVSSFTLKTGLAAGTYQFRCTLSLESAGYKMTTQPVSLEVVSVCAAKIGGTEYPSFNAAADSGEVDGKTITLMKNTTFNGAESWRFGYDVTLDLNGYTLDFGSNNIEVGEGATLTVTDSSEGKTGRLIGSTTAPLINVAGTLLLESGSFENKDANGATIADKAGSRAVSAFLADGCCYYAGENTDLNTGAVLSTGTDASVSGSICVGKAAVAQVNVGGTITRYADLFDALTAANGQTATVTLLQDTIVPETAVQADKSLHLTEGTITLDLGGHTATLLLRGIWLEGNVNLTVQNGKLDGGPENDYIVSVRAGSTFTLAASGTLKAVGGNTHALNVYSNIGSAAPAIATLHGTVIGDDGISGFVVVESEGAKLTVDGGSVQSLSFDSKATVELSGGSFGSIEAEDVKVLKAALKTGYAYKEAGEEGKWVMPASGNLTDVIVAPAPVQITEQPQSVTIAYGESTTLSVTTVGTDIKYMWNVQSSSGMNSFPGNDDGTFTFPEDATGLTAVPDDYTICAICRVMPEGSVAPLWTKNSNTATVTVTPARLTGVAVSQSGALTYTGKAQTAAVSAAATAVNGQTVSFTYCAEENGEYTGTVPAFTDAGSHTVYYKASAANHETVTGSFTVTIATAKLTGVSAEQSGALTYTGVAQTAAVTTAATAVNSQTVTFTYSAEQDGEYTGAVPAFTNAGSYTVYYKAASASHETVTGSFTVTIGRRDLSITAKKQTITYGNLISQDVSQVDAVGLASGQTLNSIALTANALTVAEGATITPSEAVISGGADNYNITYNAGTLTVTPAELKAVSVTQRGTLTYNKQAQTAVVTAAATAANAQTVSFTYCATESGEYTSVVPAFTGAGGHTVYYKAAAANHETATGYFTVTIAKAPVTAFDLTDLIATPVWNAERATALSDQSQLTGEFSWTAEGGKWEATIKFVKGEVYTADVAIRATANYTFEGISEDTVFTHDGATSITQSEIADDACTLTIVFKAVPGDNLLPEENLPEEVNNAGTFYVDGVPHNTSEFENGHIDLGAADRSNLTTYTYSGGENSYPTGMSVFSVESTEDGYTVTPKPEFSNLLQYKGCSIRTSGVKGIRMITAIPDELRAKLLKAELDGYRLMEYGTVVAFSANMAGGKLTLEDSYAKHNYAYKRGVSDAVFGRAEGLTQFTNVLVDFTPEQCKQELAMRPYIILEDANGNSQAIYGGIVYRSIGYIAWQNRDTYEAGTAEYRYIHDIIDYVYGDNTPA